MTATILRFPPRRQLGIRVVSEELATLIIRQNHHGWLFGSRSEGLRAARELSEQDGVGVINSIGEHVMEKKTYDNSGILFRNEDKDPSKPNDRDYRGELTISGVGYWVSGWIKEGKKGKFLSLAIKPKDAPIDKSKPLAQIDDAIPF